MDMWLVQGDPFEFARCCGCRRDFRQPIELAALLAGGAAAGPLIWRNLLFLPLFLSKSGRLDASLSQPEGPVVWVALAQSAAANLDPEARLRAP
jgi:hypothetical protein